LNILILKNKFRKLINNLFLYESFKEEIYKEILGKKGPFCLTIEDQLWFLGVSEAERFKPDTLLLPDFLFTSKAKKEEKIIKTLKETKELKVKEISKIKIELPEVKVKIKKWTVVQKELHICS